MRNFRTAGHFVLLLAWCSVLPVKAQEAVKSPPETTGYPAVRSIYPGETIADDLTGNETHFYQIEAAANQFLHLVVQQQGIDVVLTISRQHGERLSEVDRPIGSRGRETISLITPASGSYVLAVRSLENVTAQGRYQVSLDPLRPFAAKDKTWIDAEQAVSAGERLRSGGKAGSIRDAIQQFNHAADLWCSLGEADEEAIALYGSGMSSAALGDNQSALEYLNRALSLFELVSDKHGLSITTAALGWPYMYLGNNEQALESFSSAYRLYHELGNLKGEGVALYGIGWVHALREEYQQALNDFTDSLRRRRTVSDKRGEALTLAGMGKTEARLRNFTAALAHLKQALAILQRRDLYAEADTLSNLAWVYNGVGEPLEAVNNFKRALELRRQAGDRTGEATTLFGLSKGLRALGQLKESRLAIEDALAIIESLRAKGANQQLRISYFASIQDYYEFYISLLMQLDRIAPAAGYAATALQASERARARGLIDLLAEARIDLRRDVDPALLEQENRITEKLVTLTRQHQLQHDGKSQDLPGEIRDLTNQLETVESHIRASSPGYAAIVQPQPLSVSEIQEQVLDENTLLLEYSLGEEKSYLWAVIRKELVSYELPGRARIEGVARRLYELLNARNRVLPNETVVEKRARIALADREANSVSSELGTLLLEPAAHTLGSNRLLIVAPDALQYVAFAALPVRRNSESASGVPMSAETRQAIASNRRPLITDHEIVVLPSASTLAILRKQTGNRQPRTKTVAAFGDPVFSIDDERLPQTGSQSVGNNSRIFSFQTKNTAPSRVTSLVNDSTYPRLISSRWEAKQIVALAPPGEGKLLLDFDANRTGVTDPELNRYRFLHFATHAVINNEHPELSGIVLSMFDKNGHEQNGFLPSYEIFKLKLPVEVIVLSACRTGLGRDFKGEGLIGLTRGFMYAGAPRIVVSLWDVDDKPTSELMVRFYKRMLGPEKLSPAAALRAAQLEMSADPRWQSPYFWAPFVLQGEWR